MGGYYPTFARLPQPCLYPITSTNERGNTWGWKWCESRPTIAFSLKIIVANDMCLSLSIIHLVPSISTRYSYAKSVLVLIHLSDSSFPLFPLLFAFANNEYYVSKK